MTAAVGACRSQSGVGAVVGPAGSPTSLFDCFWLLKGPQTALGI